MTPAGIAEATDVEGADVVEAVEVTLATAGAVDDD